MLDRSFCVEMAFIEAMNAGEGVRVLMAEVANCLPGKCVYITPEKGLMLDYDLKDKDFGQDIFKNNTIGDPLN